MKKQTLLFFTILLAGIVIISSFTATKNNFETARKQVKTSYINDLETVLSSVQKLSKIVKTLSSEKDWHIVQDAFAQVRTNFKKTELLADYLDPQFSKDFLNGAPLPRIERNNPKPEVLEPEGLQTLEEMIYEEEAFASRQEIVDNLAVFENKLNEFVLFQNSVELSHREILEAVRTSLIRIYTLGVTGFDTPGSDNAIHESATSWQQTRKTVLHYIPEVRKKDKALADAILAHFNKGLEYLNKNTDFEQFDRLTFLAEYVNPLYSKLLDMYLLLGIETREESNSGLQSVNFSARNIFAADFLNANFYTGISPDQNPKLAELGKLLFFDPILSDNNKRSCASCHNPEQAFTDGVSKSMAFDFNGSVDRNSPTLINAVFADKLFFDLRAQRFEDQVEHVMVSAKEFHSSFPESVKRISASSEYLALFREAYPTFQENLVSKETISRAITAYVQSLVGLNSDFDKYVRGETSDIDVSVKRGFNLFMGKAACGTCHFAPTFSGLVPPTFLENETEVLGVPLSNDTLSPQLDTDKGRYTNGRMLEKKLIYEHSFKTPTIRNTGLSGPYMHNGVFTTLEEVMNFYNKGGGAGLGFSLPNQTLSDEPLNLSGEEIKDIISFMKSLNDTTGLTSRPARLPSFSKETNLNNRLVGGEY